MEQMIYRSWRENWFFLMRYKCGRCGNIQRPIQLKQLLEKGENHYCKKCGFTEFEPLPKRSLKDGSETL